MSELRRTTAHELSDIAAGYAIQDAIEAARRNDRRRRREREDIDHYGVACSLRDLGFAIIKKEPNG